jgi:hypothetical protein
MDIRAEGKKACNWGLSDAGSNAINIEETMK